MKKDYYLHTGKGYCEHFNKLSEARKAAIIASFSCGWYNVSITCYNGEKEEYTLRMNEKGTFHKEQIKY